MTVARVLVTAAVPGDAPDRLAALDGTLSVDSPRGAGTVVRAHIPCEADALAGSPRPADVPS